MMAILSIFQYILQYPETLSSVLNESRLGAGTISAIYLALAKMVPVPNSAIHGWRALCWPSCVWAVVGHAVHSQFERLGRWRDCPATETRFTRGIEMVV